MSDPVHSTLTHNLQGLTEYLNPSPSTGVLDIFKHYEELTERSTLQWEGRVKRLEEMVERAREETVVVRGEKERVEEEREEMGREVEYLRGEVERERRRAREREGEVRRLRKLVMVGEGAEEGKGEGREERAGKDQGNKVKVLEETLGVLSHEKKSLEEELKKARIELGAYASSHSSTSVLKEELESIIKDLHKDRSEMATLVAQLTHSKESIASLAAQNAQLSSKLQTTQHEKEQISSALNQISANAPNIQHLTAERDNLSQQVSAKDNLIAAQNSKLSQQEQELKTYKERLSTLQGLTEYLEKTLRETEEGEKKVKDDNNGEVEVLRERIQEMVTENAKLKRKERELKSLVEVREAEADRARSREEELQEQVNLLHEELITVSAQLSHVTQAYDKTAEENESFQRVLVQLQDETDEFRNRQEGSVKAVKAYEILLTEIASKVNSVGGPALRIPKLNPTKFSSPAERDHFMSLLCAFEEGVKDILGEKYPKDQNEEESEKPNTDRSQGRDVRMYEEMVEKLKQTLIDCFGVFEEVLDEPDRVRELAEVFLEYYDARVEAEKEEERLMERELLLQSSSDKIQKGKWSKEVGLLKTSLKSINDRLEYLEQRQKDLFEDLKDRLRDQQHKSQSQQSSQRSQLEIDPSEEQKITKIKPSEHSYNKVTTTQQTHKKGRRQNFFRVSRVDDIISNLIDSSGL